MIKDDKGRHDVKTVGGCVLKAKESMGKITLTDEIDYIEPGNEAELKRLVEQHIRQK